MQLPRWTIRAAKASQHTHVGASEASYRSHTPLRAGVCDSGCGGDGFGSGEWVPVLLSSEATAGVSSEALSIGNCPGLVA